MSRIKLVIILIVVALIATLVLQNTETVETKVFFATMEMPRAFLIGLSFVLGALCGFLIATRIGRKRKKEA